MRKSLGWLPILALALARPAAAAPNFLGSTGLLNTPTAMTAPMLSYDAFFFAGEEFLTWGANLGLTPAIEVGGALFDPDRGDSKGLLNAKYAVTRETFAMPGIAIGTVDLADSIDRTFYLVLTKGFGRVGLGGAGTFGLRAHAGYGSGIYDDTLFGGAELLFSDRLAVIGEYDGRNVNFGASFRLGQGVQVKGALFDADNFAAGISYSAGIR